MKFTPAPTPAPTSARSFAFAGVILATLALVGCTSTGGGNGVLGWFFGRKAAAEQRVERKETVAEDATVTAAHIEVVKTGEAIKTAEKEHPDSRAIQVAKRTNENADNILTQRKPLTIGARMDAVVLTLGLLSEETKKREAAEGKQAAAEGDARKLGEELAGLRTKLETLGKERATEAANNLALANELRVERWQKWAGVAGSLILGVAAFAYRMNFGNLQTGVGNALAHLQSKYGTKDEDVAAMKAEIDAKTNSMTQGGILSVLGKALASKA